jgi:hypothetical protein
MRRDVIQRLQRRAKSPSSSIASKSAGTAARAEALERLQRVEQAGRTPVLQDFHENQDRGLPTLFQLAHGAAGRAGVGPSRQFKPPVAGRPVVEKALAAEEPEQPPVQGGEIEDDAGPDQ